MHTERSYEVQVSSMTKTVAGLEESVRSVDNDKHNMMQDLSAVRDLCTQLEATKDSLQRQLTSATLDREKVCKHSSMMIVIRNLVHVIILCDVAI